MQPFPGRGRFFLLRHGETDWNRQHRIMGRRPVPLSARDRVFAAMARIAAAADGQAAIVVSHGDPLRLILCGCLKMDVAELRRIRVDNGALSAIELTGDWAEVKFVNMRPDLDVMLDT